MRFPSLLKTVAGRVGGCGRAAVFAALALLAPAALVGCGGEDLGTSADPNADFNPPGDSRGPGE